MNGKNVLMLVIGVVALVIAVVGITMTLDSRGVDSDLNELCTINVNGECNISLDADVGYIEMGVEIQDKDVVTAQTQNAEAMDKIINAVKELGLEDEDITTSNYSIYPYYDYVDGLRETTPEYYNVSNTVKLRVKDLNVLGDVIDVATQAGANRAYNIYFDVLDTSESQKDALAKALEDAIAKAEILEEASGVKIVGIKQITDQTYYSQGYYDYAVAEEMAYSVEGRGMASTPIMANDVEVQANVNVQFIIEN